MLELTEIINEEGKSKDIYATVVAPSTIDTPQNREAMPEADHSKWVTPELIAENILFLLSEPGRILRQPVVRIFGNS